MLISFVNNKIWKLRKLILTIVFRKEWMDKLICQWWWLFSEFIVFDKSLHY